ncbi:Condensin-2 complex subunit kle-2 [Caenorhabditis elegans]|uniref:Condensin-2 complex subunit kle-2 n=1 Tax=Caenorhabditis elegans TaxID=6239 RepID=KLE2_CAEEL|nr:Condensin-2 complex subunit kle-2 [Caenorhabditis elegans]P34341.2 RecName: Full=Condensin-2 complex subunit kle-2; AltName: Full=Kleisin, abnormal closure, protein 2 [Caenorhabditis elegans]CCD66003.1 Condensin-2 complex subunit kle-2 [Caenorhabditis elegans]|eukprot:NP_498727.2 Condensin-2 complex subunit kle-2 [Caenorhabditis elegans]
MTRNAPPGQESTDLAWLVTPAKDLVENFSIDVLKALAGYLEVIRQESEDTDNQVDAATTYRLFDFQRACRIIQGSCAVYGRKVDHVYELTISVVDLVENKGQDDGNTGSRRGAGRRKNFNLGSTNYDLADIDSLKQEALANFEKTVKEEKKSIDAVRMVENAEVIESQYERKSCLVAKPTQFMFKLNYGQLNRTDEQILNAKSRPDVIGKVKDFEIKKSKVKHDQQILYSHDCYRGNLDQFTLPGARWMPDNKELAANFGVADLEVELDLEQEHEKISAYGPFKDPLSGREVVPPPRWFIEQEAVRQNQEIQSRATSRAITIAAKTLRDSQGFGSQPTRLSQPFVERHRQSNHLNDFLSFVEGRVNKNRPSTHLTTGLVDMFVDNFGSVMQNDEPNTSRRPDENYAPMDFDDDFGGGGDDDDDDYIRNLSRRDEKRAPAPWDELDKNHIIWYTGDENLPVVSKPVKKITKFQPKPAEMLARKQRREEKINKSRRDEFMETHDYLQDYYYWRSAARINPIKDWKIESLRTAILAEKKRRIKEKTAKIREARIQNMQRKRTARVIPVEQFEPVTEDIPTSNRRTLGAEYDDVVDEDLAAEVELSMFGGGFDDDEEDVRPRGERPPMAPNNLEFDALQTDFDIPPAEYVPLRFEDIDDAELNSVINLPGNLLIDKALPLLKKFAENRTDREQMAYEMAKAYEDVDVAVSTLQEHVDKWHSRMEPILEEGETRKEYDVHAVGRAVIGQYDIEGGTKRLLDLVMDRPWYEISRYFLSCLFMCNVGNVMVSEDMELPLEERINSMKITLLKRDMHCEMFKEAGALDA